jgi:histidyl-tRNA synthetase
MRAELAARGIASAAADRVVSVFAGGLDLQRARDVLAGVPDAVSAIAELEQITALSVATSARPYLRFDPTLARGLSYYTGAIMEIAVPDLPGSLGGGGRYDGLIGMFLGEDIPACGFSLGLERILVVMAEREMFPAHVQRGIAAVLVTLFEGEPAEEALRLASELRAYGVQVELYPEPDKLGKQFKYAASRGIPRVVILGSDERARGVVTIKDMTSGEQTTVARAEAPAALRAGNET